MKKLFMLFLVMMSITSFASFSFTIHNTSPTSGIFACTYTVTNWTACTTSGVCCGPCILKGGDIVKL